jgi:hypothetical protein
MRSTISIRCLVRGVGALALALWCALPASAQPVQLLENVDLRAQPSPVAPLVGSWPAGRRVELLGLRGGWAQVRDQATVAWVRASVIDTLPALIAGSVAGDTGRRAPGNEVVSLGVRRFPVPRPNRHALIVGIASYARDAERPIETLPGVVHDMTSALAVAGLLQVPVENTTLLRDDAATRHGIAAAIADLAARMSVGDRVFVYWAGHGSRFLDPAEGACVESLLPFDLKDISNRDFANWIQPVGAKADKMLVMFDACHATGVSAAGRPLDPFRPRAAGIAGACQASSNSRTRSLAAAARGAGLSSADIVHIAAARADEACLENTLSGGLATTALRECLGGAAVDGDGSGAITMAEIATCVQARMDAALASFPELAASHLTLSGNESFVPALFAVADPTAAAPAVAPLAVADVVDEVYRQRDAKWHVDARGSATRIKVGERIPPWTITSERDGYLYIVMVGSDRQSLYLLFPNDLDRDNRIAAGKATVLPRPSWSVRAGGPPGNDTVMVVVSDGPRDLKSLAGVSSAGFSMPLTDRAGRIQLQRVFGSNVRADDGHCVARTGCSDAFGAALLTIEEYEGAPAR